MGPADLTTQAPERRVAEGGQTGGCEGRASCGHVLSMAVAAPRPSLATLLALGLSLARRGLLVGFGVAVSAITAVALAALAAALAARGPRAPLNDVPIVASSALAWGGGFLVAFAAAVHALRRDHGEGVRHLLAARSRGLRAYLVVRIGGLAALLALVVGGGTLLTGIAATLAGVGTGSALAVLQATFASLVYALAFAAVIAPTALAALGARTRVGGYVFLLVVVILPETIVEALSSNLPPGATDVLAIPSALGALRASLSPGSVDGVRLLRALAALAAFCAATVLLVRREALSLDARALGGEGP